MLGKEVIQNAINENMRRNTELLGLLRDKGVVLESNRMIEFHFWAWTVDDAMRLKTALVNNGTKVKDIVQLERDNNSLWSVAAEVSMSPISAASLEYTEKNVVLATGFNCAYDGWGTRI